MDSAIAELAADMKAAGLVIPATLQNSKGNFLPLSFAYLSSFEYEVPDPFAMKEMTEDEIKRIGDQVPPYITKLNQKLVAVKGFMVPIDVEGDKIISFILTYSRAACCFGQMPWYNEWIYVEMKDGQKAEFYNDIPITVYGDLEVGEEIEDGFVISLFRMKATEVAAEESMASAGG